ncbi:pyrimidine-specific ribonucleoside hydrolase [Arthrobacter sp. 2762]
MTRPQTRESVPVIADVDTGIDDALSLFLLARSKHIRLKAVTCVAGNTNVDQVVRNTLDVLDLAGAGVVPVGRGAERPLINKLWTAHGFHGSNGLGEIALPQSPHLASPLAAPELIRKTVADSAEPLTLLALGPLTNVALFIRVYPEYASRLARIVFMGGSGGVGNASPVAEFNAWHDPEALAIVLDSGIPITMYGLDVFYQANVPDDDYLPLLEASDPGSRLVGKLLRYAALREADDSRLAEGATIGDAGAACLIANHHVALLEEYPVSVVLSGSSRGQTMVDRRTKSGESELHGQSPEARMINVATAIDPALMRETFLSAINEMVSR